jgi:transposase InsO family protein
MSGKGNCYDNASVETFFKSLKAELIWRQKMANAATSRSGDLSVHQRVLQHPKRPFKSGLHQPSGVRSQGGIN